MTLQRKSGIIVLQTKLNRPRVTRNLLTRPRLLAQLNAGLEGAITLVIAPAGFGKTTLVSSWMRDTIRDNGAVLPATWLTLDQGDSELTVFLRYFIAALQVIFPEAGAETLRLLSARHQIPTRVLLDSLSNEIDALPSRFVMAIDDLHAPQGRALFESLNEWLEHWPRQMHLVLLSRFDPSLPLTSLRAKGLLTEIRSRDLRFTRAEMAEYFDQTLGFSLDAPSITLLHEWLDGWGAGLRMASLLLAERKSVDDLTTAFLDNDVFVADYLVEAVIACQPPSIQRFLLETSILDQFSLSLAEALMDDQDADCNAQDCLNYIRTADLFLTQLDNHREWYRYQRVFREALRQKLSVTYTATQIKALHARAAEWFFAHGLPDQAIHHAMAAGDFMLTAAYMEQDLCAVLNREDRSVLERRLRMLPEEFINQNPWLLLMVAYVHGMRWELDLAARVARAAEDLIDKSDRSERTQILRGLIDVLKSQALCHVGQHEQVVTLCNEALAKLPEEWQYARGSAVAFIGVSLHASGRPEATQRFLIGQYQSHRDKTDSYAQRILLATAINHVQCGDYEKAERTVLTVLQQVENSQLQMIRGWGNYLLGFLNYEWNNLTQAADYFGRVTDSFYTTQLAVARNGFIGQAYTAQAQGRFTEAMQTIDKLSSIDLEARGQELIDTASARARLLFMDGNIEGAERLILLNAFQSSDQSLLIWMEQSSLTKACVLIARNKGADTKNALQILDAIGQLAERTLNNRIAIEVLALRSLAMLNLGDSAGARDTLIRAIELGRPGLFTRTFVDLGPQMQKLLSQIIGYVPVSKSVSRILAAFPQAEAVGGPLTLAHHVSPALRVGIADDDVLDEHLTQRELEILMLMAEPISFRDIALRMHISYTTARRYTINVYSKFGVHSRWEVVNSAIRKGIIAPR